MQRLDLKGHRYGRLTVLAMDLPGVRGPTWRCVCDCGGEARVTTAELRAGNTSSCGCLKKEANRGRLVTHDKSQSAAYLAWTNMKIRVSRTSGPSWRTYGARGIAVCERWQTFENFYADMGDPPEGLQLDRIDNDKGYEPGNCRWTTALEQGRNRRNVTAITFNGRTLNVSAWADVVGLSRNALRVRLANGWPVERALTEPAHRH